MKTKLLKYGSRAFVIGIVCGLLFLLGQVATLTTLAQLPTASPGGTLNFLSDSLAIAFNADSHGTRSWFLRGPTLTPIVTGNWTNLGVSCTRTAGSNYLTIIGTLGTSPNVCGYQHAVSAGNFSYIFVFYATVPNTIPAEVQIGFTDGTKVEGFGPESGGTNVYSIDTVKSTALTAGTYSSSNGAAVSAWGPIGAMPIVAKLSRTGTTLTGALSIDGGLTFGYTVFNDTTPFLTASAIYISTDPRTSSATAVASTATLVSSTLQ